MHHGITPPTAEGPAISTTIPSEAIDFVHAPFTMVRRPIWPSVDTKTVLLTALELALIPGLVIPSLNAVTFLHVQCKLSFVRGSSKCFMPVDAVSMSEVF